MNSCKSEALCFTKFLRLSFGITQLVYVSQIYWPKVQVAPQFQRAGIISKSSLNPEYVREHFPAGVESYFKMSRYHVWNLVLST